MKLMVTGANGFVGASICNSLKESSIDLIKVVRTARHSDEFVVGDIDAETNWQELLYGVDVIIHTAARVHIMKDFAGFPLSEFRRVNVDGTLNLARQAKSLGVRRFIFISSIKVNGEGGSNFIYRYDDFVHPEDDYALSKWEAEQGLKKICSDGVMELVIIRPPLIYGPGVKGNLALLCKAIDKGIPLPLGAIRNRRDMLSLNNLIDLLRACIDHPKAAGNVFLCSDNEPVSTPQLVNLIAKARGKMPHLWRVPTTLLACAARFSGKTPIFERLSGDFKIDIQHTMETLDWKPPFSVAQSMQRAFSKNA